jgi:MFS family permease
VVSLSGLVNQVNDALVWGLLPAYLLTRGLHPATIGAIAAIYPALWALSQPAFGALSDRIGRAPLLIAGFLAQAAGIAAFAATVRSPVLLIAAGVLGLGTGMVYPTLIAVIGDHTSPQQRPAAVGTYRLWRDLGYVAGALIVGTVTDTFGARAAIITVAVITAIPALLICVVPVGNQPSTTPS